MFSFKGSGILQYQDNWEGRYRNGRVASLDYTQLREYAASEVLR
jgi:hypothetical protein